MDSETYTGVLTPSGTNYRLGGGGGTLTYLSALTDMTGSIGLAVNGPASGGAVILTSGNNSYSGPTVVSSGTLQVGDGLTTNGSLPNGSVTDNGALIFANPSNMTFTGAIGGNGQLAKTGAGLMVLSASETYTGSTLISTGTLQVNYPLATSGIALSNSGVFAANIANAWTLTMANFISGTGSVVKSGVGTLTLEAANNVHVENCTFIGTDVGLRFKSTRGRGGVVEKIYISNLRMMDIAGDAINFNLYYGGKAPLDETADTPETLAPPVTEKTPQFRDIHMENIVCRGVRKAIVLQGLPEMPIRDISLKEVAIASEAGVFVTDAEGIHFQDVRVKHRSGAALSQLRVKDSSLDLLQ